MSKSKNKEKNTKKTVYENIPKLPLLVYEGEIRIRKVYITNLL